MGDAEDTVPQSGTERSLPRELANAASDNERQGVVASEARWNSGAIQGVGLASLRASVKVFGFASVSESQGFAFAVANEMSLDAKRSVASKFFDWSCDAVQQRGWRLEDSRVGRMGRAIAAQLVPALSCTELI